MSLSFSRLSTSVKNFVDDVFAFCPRTPLGAFVATLLGFVAVFFAFVIVVIFVTVIPWKVLVAIAAFCLLCLIAFLLILKREESVD